MSNDHTVHSRIGALLLSVAIIFCSSFGTAQLTPDQIINSAQQAIGKASPVNLVLGGLIDRAVDSGNTALQQRLDQLNGILQSAILNLNNVLRENIQTLDSDVRRQREETVRSLSNLIDQINTLIQADFTQLDSILEQNITNLQNSLGNAIASLPIPVEPLVNVGRMGISIIRQQGPYTKLTLTGSGLFKGNFTPEVSLMEGDKKIPLKVEAASMSLLLIDIPNNALPNGVETRHYILKLTLKKGGIPLLRSYPSFPLQVCGAVPKFTFDAALSFNDGVIWQKQITDPVHIYLGCDGGGQTTPITAAAPDPWIVDKEVGTSGLIIANSGGDNYHSEQFLPGTATYQLYCAKNNGRGSNSWADVRYAQKRRLDTPQCGRSEVLNTAFSFGEPKQVQLNVSQALGSCDLSLATPRKTVTITVKRSDGQAAETVNMPFPFTGKTAQAGTMSFAVDEQGLLNASYSPACRVKYSYATE